MTRQLSLMLTTHFQQLVGIGQLLLHSLDLGIYVNPSMPLKHIQPLDLSCGWFYRPDNP